MIGRWLGNYQTTLIGLAGAGLVQVSQGTNWKTVLASMLVALFGLVSKDANTGSRPGAGS